MSNKSPRWGDFVLARLKLGLTNSGIQAIMFLTIED